VLQRRMHRGCLFCSVTVRLTVRRNHRALAWVFLFLFSTLSSSAMADPSSVVGAGGSAVDEVKPQTAEGEGDKAEPGAVEGAKTPQISVVFIGPGDDVYTLYGHTVLTVRRPGEAQADARTYNFGATDFEAEGYVKRFATGRVEFWGTAAPYGELMKTWGRQDRTVVRYPINLSPDAARRLALRLEHDVQPVHSHFTYDTFRANCATKIRDLLDTYTGGAVFAALGDVHNGRSYRDDVKAAFAGRTGLLMLTEIVPGVSLDAPRTHWEQAFLPAHLERGLVSVDLPNGGPLLGASMVDHSRIGPDPRDGWPHIAQAVLIFFTCLAVLLAYLAPRLSARARGYILSTGVTAYALLGLLLIAVHTTTDWSDLKDNWLLAVVLPLDAFLLWPALRLASRAEPPTRLARKYVGFRIVFTGLVVLLTPLVLAGPWAPKWAALAGLVAGWRLMGDLEKKADTSPERLYTKRTGEYPALSRARKRRTM